MILKQHRGLRLIQSNLLKDQHLWPSQLVADEHVRLTVHGFNNRTSTKGGLQGFKDYIQWRQQTIFPFPGKLKISLTNSCDQKSDRSLAEDSK